MKNLSRKTANVVHVYPERILQFGGGNFLRGFVDWIIDKYNRQSNDEKLGILAVKVRKEGSYQNWKNQDGLYHLFTKGYVKGRTVDEMVLIKSISRILEVHNEYDEFIASAKNPQLNVVVSNTTETGLAFDDRDQKENIPLTFPGQLCKWLHARWQFFQNDRKGRCVIIPCELIDQNGEVLKDTLFKYISHWQLEDEFKTWIDTQCQFCNSLVDRIIPGIDRSIVNEYQERTGYEDSMMTEGEPYHLWAIETKHDISQKLPIDRIGLNVIFTKDLKPYKEQKLKILNGSHTAMVPIGLLLEIELVKEAVNHPDMGPFIEKMIFEEIIPSLDIDRDQSEEFGNNVLDRFKNPFLEHKLESISLYSISKFNARFKPTIKSFVSIHKRIPERLLLAFASLLVFYKGELGGRIFELKDEEHKIEKMTQHWIKLNADGVISPITIQDMLADEELWDEDLNKIEGFSSSVSNNIIEILEGNLAKKVAALKI